MANIATFNFKTNKKVMIETEDFNRAYEMIEAGYFEDYDLHDADHIWFTLFFDEQDRQWSVMETKDKKHFALFIDDDLLCLLGNLEMHIINFIESKKEADPYNDWLIQQDALGEYDRHKI